MVTTALTYNVYSPFTLRDRDETETRRWYVSRPSRDQDAETETTNPGFRSVEVTLSHWDCGA